MPYRPISPIWKNKITTLTDEFDQWWGKLAPIMPDDGCDVFFRADDIGYPGHQFSRMISIFKENSAPLALAVVPGWMNTQRAGTLIKNLSPEMHLWCLHQHGCRHMNFEKTGKKFEFGPSRDISKVTLELSKGQHKLRQLLGDNFCPLFTPPWNRCTAETMDALHKLEFKAISRSTNVFPESPDGLPDIPVNVDLHTVKVEKPSDGIKALQEQLEKAVRSNVAGIMLHHQRMNETSALFLDYLIKKITNTSGFRVIDIRSMVP